MDHFAHPRTVQLYSVVSGHVAQVTAASVRNKSKVKVTPELYYNKMVKWIIYW